MPWPMGKHSVRVVVRGAALVLLAVGLQGAGVLGPLESLLEAEGQRHCQGAAAAVPAASLVHLDVDDNALNYIGRWPWPPTRLARILDEVGRARPRVVAMDVLFAEPRGVVFGRNDPVGVDEDAALAGAVRRLGCAVVPVSLRFAAGGPPSAVRRAVLPALIADPERTPEQCRAVLRAAGLAEADLDRDPADSFLTLREAAFHERIWRELDGAGGDGDPGAVREAVRRAMLPHADPLLTGTPLGRLFDEEYARVARERAVVRFGVPPPAGGIPVVGADAEQTPILPLAEAAAYGGFVDYLPESVEGTVRSVPLLAECHGRVYPQLGLSAAAAVLGLDLRRARLTATSLTLPRARGGPDVVLPVSVRRSTAVGSVGALMEVPLFGRPRDWLTMYDVPRHERQARHVSVYRVWQACETADKIDRNRATEDQLLLAAAVAADPDAARAFRAPQPGPARRQLIAETLHDTAEFVGNLGTVADLDPASRQMLQDARRRGDLLGRLAGQDGPLDGQLADLRAGLRQDLGGRTIFFGGTATSLADLRPTALFGSTPGVVIHGAVYNAILTGRTWRRTSAGLGLALTAAAGLATLAVVAGLSPGRAFAASLALAGGYLAFDGYVLFARADLFVAAAGPAVAVGVVWSGSTLTDYLTEQRARVRITRRFRAYVDPRVVDYVEAHPDRVRFDGERRELTVGFSDLAGFTTLTDQIGERVVPLLGEYVGHMIPVIRDHRGTFDKQVGDGLCFFFGAPEPDADHAAQGVRTALAMHAALAAFNRSLAGRGLPPLGMRVGLASGEVIVGDAGSADAASYTTLGGTTNLAARLESANKVFGTATLVSARTVELLGGRFLCRPIANLRVAGRLSCTVVYEPLCATADATDHDRRLAAATAEVVDAYRRADFPACGRHAAAMAAAFGPCKLTALYADRAATADPNREDHCDGQIVLTEK